MDRITLQTHGLTAPSLLEGITLEGRGLNSHLKPSRRVTRLSLAFVALCALAITVVSCGKDGNGADPAPPPAEANVDVSRFRDRLGPEFWTEVQTADWIEGDAATPDGARLLEALATSGPLASRERKLAIAAAYPEGLSEEQLAVARQYARMAIREVHEILDAPWLLDGIDGYERAVFTAAGQRTIAPSALKLAIEERFFVDLYETDPALVTSRRLDAMGALGDQLRTRVEQEPWFQDGLDDYDVSLLGILSEVIQVEEAIEILDTRSYRPLKLNDTTLAVVLIGRSERLKEDGFKLVQDSIRDVESFVGEFQSIGLLVDVTPIPGDPFCHATGGNQYTVGVVSLTSSGCFHREVVVHELAHAFVGGRYPVWFTEGIAEMVTYHVFGAPAGYGGGNGLIEPEGNYFVGSPTYLNQASLGTDFLLDAYDLGSPEAMSKFTREIAGQRLSGQEIISRIRAIEGIDRQGLEALISRSFGASLPPASSGVPAATPSPTSR
ncbi:MAG TPA: hypothetical protein VG845_11815 [Dehalococcoidia bacterium]|nr:hypothetical protein [Dehalococcoidia bacterium]